MNLAPDLKNVTGKFDPVNFRQRLISALVLIPVVLIGIWRGGWLFDVLVLLVMGLGWREWMRMVCPAASKSLHCASVIVLVVVLLLGGLQAPMSGAMAGLVLVLLLFLLAAREQPDSAGWVVLGLPYLAGSGLALIYLRDLPGNGAILTAYLMVAVWSTDIGAYLAGRIIGGPKLLPEISPKKTWAGLFGGMALAAAIGYGMAVACGARQAVLAAGVALVLALVSQLGDLFESYVKRRSGVKDSGGLIPGHGGILDRIDGLLFAAVFFVMFQLAAGNDLQWW